MSSSPVYWQKKERQEKEGGGVGEKKQQSMLLGVIMTPLSSKAAWVLSYSAVHVTALLFPRNAAS